MKSTTIKLRNRFATLTELYAHVRQRYVPKYGRVVAIKPMRNMLGEDWFRDFHFSSGRVVVFGRDCDRRWHRA